jgi:PAS domain S-box-containing protein
MDLDLKMTWVSPSSAKVRGFTTDEIIALPIERHLTPTSLIKAAKLFEKIMLGENQNSFKEPDSNLSVELEFYCKDGHAIVLECKFQFIRDDSGKPTSVLAVGRDVTSRKEAETVLAKTLAELKRSNEELQQFAYVASHDLQEPLRMVSSYVQLLEKRYKDKLDDDAHDFINYAVSGARRMQNLINDLLSYSRIGTRGKPFQPVDCSEVLYAATSNLEVAIRENEALIDHSDLPQVFGDEGQLIQVFQNVIGNAIKFHGAVPPVVRVDATRNNGNWVFSVKDNGIGIDPQFFERIFLVFQRLHREEYPGTGIGLSVARKIVQRHGGQIWLESDPGKGSTFYFTIPTREEEGGANQ